MGDPSRPGAADGDAVTVGGTFSGTTTTQASTTAATAFEGASTSGAGLVGASGSSVCVHGFSASGTAIIGEADEFGSGVERFSTGGQGVHGETADSGGGAGDMGVAGSLTGPNHGTEGRASGPTGAGTWGWCVGGSGAVGTTGPSFPPVAPHVGLFGIATDLAGATTGVHGVSASAAGTGVRGFVGAGAPPAPAPKTGVVGRCDIDATSHGALGTSAPGQGVRGDATTTGVGVLATAPLTGVALRASGKVVFNRSGRATVAAGTSSKTVSLAGVTTGSLVFAVLASSRSGRYVRAVVSASGSFTIYLNTTVLSSTLVSRFALNQTKRRGGGVRHQRTRSTDSGGRRRGRHVLEGARGWSP